jgi:N-acetylglucosamine-6-sulfatase
MIKREENVPDRFQPKPWNSRMNSQIGMIKALAAVDESVGEVIKALEKEGVLDNTVIIFSSDNGFFYGEHQFGDKRIAYEQSMRIPMIVRYPKMIKANTKISQTCLNIDIAPTLVDLAKAEIPSQFQGESMLKLFKGERVPEWRSSFMFEYFVDRSYPLAGPDMLAIRNDRFKYVDNFYKNNTDIDELYDLQKDPGEMVNEINNPKYAKELEKLKVELEALKVKYKYNSDRNWRLKQVNSKKQPGASKAD